VRQNGGIVRVELTSPRLTVAETATAIVVVVYHRLGDALHGCIIEPGKRTGGLGARPGP